MSLAKLIETKNEKINGGSMKKLIVSLMLIISMFAFAAESAPSATVGYVKYSNVATAGTDLNQVAVCLNNGWTNNNQIDPTSTYYNSVQKWNPVTQAYANSSYTLGMWRNTFAITTGDALVLNVKTGVTSHDLIVNGPVVTVPAYNLIVNAAAGDLNHIMLPLSKGALSTTALLGADIGSNTFCNSIQKWNNATQSYANSAYTLGAWRNVFNTYIADPLMVNMTNAKSWPSGGGKDDEVTGSDWNDAIATPKAGSRLIYTLIDDGASNFFSMADVGRIVWDAYIVARPAEIIRWNDAAQSYPFDDFGVPALSAVVDPQFFATPWLAGDVLHTRIKDETLGLENQYDFTLDADNSPTMIGFDSTFGPGTDWPTAPFNTPLPINNPSSIDDQILPSVTKLHQNYPNPFNPTTTIKFDLSSDSVVKLNVYNYSGQLVKSLVDGSMKAGFHTVNFDASNLSAGVYYYTMETASKTMTQKMVLVK
jgi:hypothetical protein